MTREQYLKHKEVMDQFYHQPECTAIWCKNCSGWVKTTRPSWFLESTYVINDKYIDLRKAVVDGETIQWEQTENNWIDLPKNYDFIKAEENGATIEEYRIKPEEPKFKIGDWVRRKGYASTIFRVNAISTDYTHSNTSEHYLSTNLELWEPKEGEKILVWNNNCDLICLATFLTMEGNMYCTSEKLCGNSYWDNCIPFIGELPNIPK